MKRFLLGAFLVVVIISVCSLAYFLQNQKPVSQITQNKNFVVNPGDGISSIAARLEKNNLIRNRYVFMASAFQLGLQKSLQAGLFQLSTSMSTREIALKLSSGGRQDVWLKILDGQRIAELETEFNPNLEGYIFPDSYLIPQDYSVAQIEQIVKNNFDKKFAQAKEGSATTLSDEEIVILASLIEREARTLPSKRKVAGVLLNRLKINMPLQIDATLQYVRDSQNKPSKYWLPVSVADKSTSSPYNTYHYQGLPPAPICNPGFDALYAAFHPENLTALYYITGNDNLMHFADTLDEHNTNIEKYLK